MGTPLLKSTQASFLYLQRKKLLKTECGDLLPTYVNRDTLLDHIIPVPHLQAAFDQRYVLHSTSGSILSIAVAIPAIAIVCLLLLPLPFNHAISRDPRPLLTPLCDRINKRLLNERFREWSRYSVAVRNKTFPDRPPLVFEESSIMDCSHRTEVMRDAQRLVLRSKLKAFWKGEKRERVAEMLEQKRIKTRSLARARMYFTEGGGPKLTNDNQKKVVGGNLQPQEKVAWLIHFYDTKPAHFGASFVWSFRMQTINILLLFPPPQLVICPL